MSKEFYDLMKKYLWMEKEYVLLEDINQILNYDYIFNIVEWCNFTDKCTIFSNGKINTWYHFEDNEYKEFQFDEVLCMGFHSFSGTDYSYQFYLNKELLNIHLSLFSYDIEKLKFMIDPKSFIDYEI